MRELGILYIKYYFNSQLLLISTLLILIDNSREPKQYYLLAYMI